MIKKAAGRMATRTAGTEPCPPGTFVDHQAGMDTCPTRMLASRGAGFHRADHPARRMPALLVTILAAGLLLALGWALIDRSAALATVEGQTPPTGDGFRQERDARPDAPTISFIDSQTPSCLLLDYQRDVCQVQFNYLYVTAASSQYIISMSVRIDDRIRAYYSGFFQTYMYVPADMNGKGFTVRCGLPGSGGNPYLGKGYSYTIRARETGGLGAANYGTVYCPAGPRMIHLPLVRKN